MSFFGNLFGTKPAPTAPPQSGMLAMGLGKSSSQLKRENFMKEWNATKLTIPEDIKATLIDDIDFWIKEYERISSAGDLLALKMSVTTKESTDYNTQVEALLQLYTVKIRKFMMHSKGLQTFHTYIRSMNEELQSKNQAIKKKAPQIPAYIPDVPSGRGGRRKTRSKRQDKKTRSKRQHKKTRR